MTLALVTSKDLEPIPQEPIWKRKTIKRRKQDEFFTRKFAILLWIAMGTANEPIP